MHYLSSERKLSCSGVIVQGDRSTYYYFWLLKHFFSFHSFPFPSNARFSHLTAKESNHHKFGLPQYLLPHNLFSSLKQQWFIISHNFVGSLGGSFSGFIWAPSCCCIYLVGQLELESPRCTPIHICWALKQLEGWDLPTCGLSSLTNLYGLLFMASPNCVGSRTHTMSFLKYSIGLSKS